MRAIAVLLLAAAPVAATGSQRVATASTRAQLGRAAPLPLRSRGGAAASAVARPLIRLRGGGPLGSVSSAASAAASAVLSFAYAPLGALPPRPRGWTILGFATAFELASTLLLKLGEGMARPIPSALGTMLYALSFLAFNWSLRYIEISKAYAIWSALVIALLALCAGAFFKEGLTPMRIGGIVATICGTAMISLSENGEGAAVPEPALASAATGLASIAIPLVMPHHAPQRPRADATAATPATAAAAAAAVPVVPAEAAAPTEAAAPAEVAVPASDSPPEALAVPAPAQPSDLVPSSPSSPDGEGGGPTGD